MKEETKKTKKFNKKYLAFGILGLFALALVTAGLVSYYSNTITEEITVEQPITLVGDEFTLDITHSGEDSFALIELTNNADVDVFGAIEFVVGPNSDGIHMAISEDINYCLASMGDMDGVTDCKEHYMTWLTNNVDWMDWDADSVYNELVYRNDLVINHGENSFDDSADFVDNVLSFPIEPEHSLPANTTLYAVVYVVSDFGLTPNTYTFDVTIVE